MRRQIADIIRIKNKSVHNVHKQYTCKLLNDSEFSRKPLYFQINKACKLSTHDLKPFKFRKRDTNVCIDVTPLKENPSEYKFRVRLPKKNLSGEFRYKARNTIERIKDFKREQGIDFIGDSLKQRKPKMLSISPLFDNIFTHYRRQQVRNDNSK